MPNLTLDRIVQGRAVLVDEDGNEWEIPASFLPEGSAEGDLVDVRLRRRKTATKKLSREIQELQEKLKKLKVSSPSRSTESHPPANEKDQEVT